MSKPTALLAMLWPIRPIPRTASVRSRHLVPEPRQVGVPGRPLARAHLHLGRVEPARDRAHHEEGVLGGGVGEDVRGVGVGDPVTVRGRAVDVVDAHRDLGDDAEPRGRPGREDLLVDRVPEGGDEGGDPRADLLEDERLRGRLDLVVDLDLPPALAEAVQGGLADVAGDVDPVGHGLALFHGGSDEDNIAGVRPTDLRGMLQYVPQFREKTFVVAVDGAAVADENFVNILMDVAVLWSLSIRTVLVHGASDQIKALAEQRGLEPSDLEGSGVTDAATLKLALTAANRLTHEILEGLSAADLRAASTNAVIAHPLGILKGVDHLFTGKVERIDVGLLQTLLSNGIVPVVPPLGLDGEGHTYRLNSDAVALELAKALGAVKLIYITTTDGLIGGRLARPPALGGGARRRAPEGDGGPRPGLEGPPRGRRPARRASPGCT